MMVIRVMMVLGMLSASPPTSCLSTCVVRGDDGKDVVALSGVPTGVGVGTLLSVAEMGGSHRE